MVAENIRWNRRAIAVMILLMAAVTAAVIRSNAAITRGANTSSANTPITPF